MSRRPILVEAGPYLDVLKQRKERPITLSDFENGKVIALDSKRTT